MLAWHLHQRSTLTPAAAAGVLLYSVLQEYADGLRLGHLWLLDMQRKRTLTAPCSCTQALFSRAVNVPAATTRSYTISCDQAVTTYWLRTPISVPLCLRYCLGASCCYGTV